MLQALGFKFYDAKGELVGFGGRFLITTIPELKDCTFKVACDVNNPLFGDNGASYIYGPQKGATPKIIEELDNGLINSCKKVLEQRYSSSIRCRSCWLTWFCF